MFEILHYAFSILHYYTMISIFQKLFVSKKQQNLFLLLALTTLLDVVLVLFRMAYLGFDLSEVDSVWEIKNSRGTTFLFLVWNLFLAWIPYLLSLTFIDFASFKNQVGEYSSIICLVGIFSKCPIYRDRFIACRISSASSSMV